MQCWKLNALKSYWILSPFSSSLLLLSSPPLAPAGMDTLYPRMGCTSPQHAQDLHLSCSCSGKSRWTEFPPEERSPLCLQGPSGVCWWVLTNTSHFFTSLERKCVWLHAYRSLLFVNLLPASILNVIRTTPPKPLQRKDWVAGMGATCCSRKPAPTAVVFLP